MRLTGCCSIAKSQAQQTRQLKSSCEQSMAGGGGVLQGLLQVLVPQGQLEQGCQ
jgi:hypothetical protein